MKFKRVVVKLGTNVAIEKDQVAADRIRYAARFCAEAVRSGTEVLVVSSGAVGLGRRRVSNRLTLKKETTLSQKQAFAAIGQGYLMQAWQRALEETGLTSAQVLVTAQDFSVRENYLNLRETLRTLLHWSVIPILNENDSVSTIELREGKAKSFGDNDRLSAIVATKIDADLLVLLTDVDGVYGENPKKNSSAKRLSVIQDLSELSKIQKDGKSELGRGGMEAKLEAARVAAIGGVPVFVTSGLDSKGLDSILSVKNLEELSEFGTVILPKAKLPGKKKWIGLVSGFSGILVLNEGAVTALVKKKASLLPGGVVSVKGEFSQGDVVSLQDESGREVGRGMSSYSASKVKQIQGLKTRDVRELLGKDSPDEVIHRDFLMTFETDVRE